MDTRLEAKFEALLKDDFLRRKDREAAIAERFEEVVQELAESAGMRYESKPRINNKTPDGVIHHAAGRVYIEAVSAQGPDQFNDQRGEVDLCRLLSPKLIPQKLHLHLSYRTVRKDQRGIDQDHQAAILREPISRKDADSVLKQVKAITQEPPGQQGAWSGEVEIKKRKLRTHVSQHPGRPGKRHVGHSRCAVEFVKPARIGGNISDRYKADRKRITRKIEKYKRETLNGRPLIVALDSQDTRTYEEAAAVAYGTAYPSLTQDPESGQTMTAGAQTGPMQDGIWADTRGNQRRHLAAIWIFNSWNTAKDLPLLAINPFLEDAEVERAIPQRMMDVSMVCRPRPDGRTFTRPPMTRRDPQAPETSSPAQHVRPSTPRASCSSIRPGYETQRTTESMNPQTAPIEKRRAPEQTPAWGTPGCPILAQAILQKLAETKTPEEIQSTLNRLERAGDNPTTRAEVRKLLEPGGFQKGWYVVPAGIPLEWLERLPASARTRKGIQRNFRSRIQRPWQAEGLTVEEYTRMRNIGIMSANELACLIESTETSATMEWRADGEMPLEGFAQKVQIHQSAGQSILAGPQGQDQDPMARASFKNNEHRDAWHILTACSPDPEENTTSTPVTFQEAFTLLDQIQEDILDQIEEDLLLRTRQVREQRDLLTAIMEFIPTTEQKKPAAAKPTHPDPAPTWSGNPAKHWKFQQGDGTMSMQMTFQEAFTQMTQTEDNLLLQLEQVQSRKSQLSTVLDFLTPGHPEMTPQPDRERPGQVSPELRELMGMPNRSMSDREAVSRDTAPQDPYERAMQMTNQTRAETPGTTQAARTSDAEKLGQLISWIGLPAVMEHLQVDQETMIGLQDGSTQWSPHNREWLHHAWEDLGQINRIPMKAGEIQRLKTSLSDDDLQTGSVIPGPDTASPGPDDPSAGREGPEPVLTSPQETLTLKDRLEQMGRADPQTPLIPGEIAEHIISLGISNASPHKLRYRVGRAMRNSPSLYRNNGDGTYQFTGPGA